MVRYSLRWGWVVGRLALEALGEGEQLPGPAAALRGEGERVVDALGQRIAKRAWQALSGVGGRG